MFSIWDSLTHYPWAPSDSIAPPTFLLCGPQHKQLISQARVDTFNERIGVRSKRPGFYPSSTPAVLGGFPTVLDSPGFRSLHGNWAAHSAWHALQGLSTRGWASASLQESFCSRVYTTAAETVHPPWPPLAFSERSASAKLQSCSSHAAKASNTWGTITHCQDWVPAWDEALAPSGPQLIVVTLRKYFPDVTSVAEVSS